MGRARRTPLLLLLLALTAPLQAGAVVVLDSTWREEGGRRGREDQGFGAHIRLAHQPQFDALMSFYGVEEEDWGVASGTWIGNDQGKGYILTAAHNFNGENGTRLDARAYKYRSLGGTVYQGEQVWINPGYKAHDEEVDRTGYDIAIVRLSRPVTDAGAQPFLYAGQAEKGRVLTFVGFGSRGIGSQGEDDRYIGDNRDKAAAQGLVEDVLPAQDPATGDAGNYIGVFLPKEDGSIENNFGGSRRPVSRYAGLLGSGDSGGSAWIQFDGTWVIVGVNANGDGDTYGDHSWFGRVALHKAWIQGIVPSARFYEDGTAVAKPIPAIPAPNRARPQPQPAAALCRRGTPVEVLWKGDWYLARVRGEQRANGNCPIIYDESDEKDAVEPTRLRARTE